MNTDTRSLTISLDSLTFVGSGLSRPECVLATASGRLLVADWRGGVTVVEPDGRQAFIEAKGDVPAGGIKPNGIALCRDGSFLLAHLDDTEGGVWKLTPDGSLSPWLTEIDGVPLPPTNFVHIDEAGRIWVTVSTRIIPRTLARTGQVADGFVILVDDASARIVADDLGYTNEAKVDPTGRWLVVNETFGRRVSRFAISADGSLGARETVAAFDDGVYPDGLEFDAEGGLWIVSIYSNRVVRIRPDGQQDLIVEDNDPDYLAELESDYQSGALIHRPPETIPGKILDNISSMAFGGPDLRTVYLGCLQGSRIAAFRSPIAGAKPAYWHWL